MPKQRIDTPRWVVQHIDEYTVRCAKELAIRYDMRIAEVVEVAIYRLYADPKPLERGKGGRNNSRPSDKS